MSRIALFAAALVGLLAWTAAADAADVLVKGYVTQKGTVVAPYYRTAPDNTTLNNYSTKPNVNPYTGALGTKSPTPPVYTSPYPTTPLYGTPARRY